MAAYIFGIAFFITFYTKMILHNHIDLAHHRGKSLEWLHAFTSPRFALPYWKPVKERFKTKKIVCNVFFLLSWIMFILTAYFSSD
jgi:hypothetical protein